MEFHASTAGAGDSARYRRPPIFCRRGSTACGASRRHPIRGLADPAASGRGACQRRGTSRGQLLRPAADASRRAGHSAGATRNWHAGTFGVRDAALHWLRFLVDDLGRVPQARTRSSPAANRVALVRSQALYTLQAIIEQAVRPDPNWRELPRFARIQSMLRHPGGPPITDAPPTGPALDFYDLASATLDVFLSTDRDKKISGLTGLMGRPTHFDGGGIPVSDKDGPFEGAGAIFINRATVELASLHSRFGGPAPTGSPAEAVACKTLSILMGLADRKLPHSAAFRRYMWAYMVGDEWYGAGGTTGRIYERRFRVLRATALLAGLLDGQEAQLYAPNILAHAEQAYLASGSGPSAAQFRQAVISAFQTIRDISRYATGPGRAAFTKLVDEHFARVRRIAAAVQAAREPVWPEMAKLVIMMPRFSDPDKIPPVMEKGNRAGLLRALQQYLDLWDQSAPDISPAEWQALCPPAATPPRVVLIARGARRDYIIDRLYPGVPTAIDLVFDEPYDGESYPVSIEAGGKLDLTAQPVNGDHRLFRTQSFLPGHS